MRALDKSAFGLCKKGNAYRSIVTYYLKKC